MASLGGVPQLDFSIIGDLPKTIRDARISSNRERTLAELGRGADVGTVARRLFQAGDIEGGLSLSRLADAQAMREYNMKRDERDFRFREDESRRTQFNADRQFDASGTTVKEIDDGAGGKRMVRVDRAGNVTPIEIPGQPTGPANPFLTGKPGTEGQQNAQLYANRMLGSEKVMREVENIGTSWWERAKGVASDKLGVNMRGPEFQKFDQARRDFINATLRRESGAVISEAEFDNANKQYFPMPGDTPEVIKQKRANRIEAIKGIGAAGGPGYRPPMTIGANGELVPNQPQRAADQTARASKFRKGQTATNPTTGAKIVFDGTQWVPAQ
jgi:hypothetical protein